jgi:hypothetical protein
MKDSNVSKEQYEALRQQIEKARSDENPELSSIHADIERLKQEYGEKVAGAGKLRDELEALLKSDSTLISGSPTIKKIEDTLLYQKNMAKDLLGGEPGPNGHTPGVNLAAILQANGYENGILDAIAKEILDTEENLPNKEELAALKDVPAKIDKLNKWAHDNEETDEDQNQYLSIITDKLKKVDTNVNRERPSYSPGTDEHFYRNDLHSVDPLKNRDKATSDNYDSDTLKYQINKNLTPTNRDAELMLNDLFNQIQTYDSRIENLLANVKTNGNKKSQLELKQDTTKIDNIFYNAKNDAKNIYRDLKNKDEKSANHFLTKYNKLIKSKIDNLRTAYKYMPLDHDNRTKTRGTLVPVFQLDSEKIAPSHLPESYLKEIDTLAERILGEQYGKYLK